MWNLMNITAEGTLILSEVEYVIVSVNDTGTGRSEDVRNISLSL
jgi:hypothetical protein